MSPATFALCLALQLPQDPGLEKFGLKPTVHVQAVGGKATIAEGETIELLGFADLAQSNFRVSDLNGRALDKPTEDLFWSILDDRRPDDLGRVTSGGQNSKEFVLDTYRLDRDKRTVAMAFRLSPNLTTVVDPTADAKRFLMALAVTKPVSGSGSGAYIGVARVLRPLFPKDSTATSFDLRFEVPGGEWVTLAEFPFGQDTKFADGAIDVRMRWQQHSDFRTVDDRQVVVDYKGYYFTVTLPESLREMELEIVTNDPAEDMPYLPSSPRHHSRGEDYDEAFKGKDLFMAYGLNKRSEGRRFTLRARPKRIVTFAEIPYKRPGS